MNLEKNINRYLEHGISLAIKDTNGYPVELPVTIEVVDSKKKLLQVTGNRWLASSVEGQGRVKAWLTCHSHDEYLDPGSLSQLTLKGMFYREDQHYIFEVTRVLAFVKPRPGGQVLSVFGHWLLSWNHFRKRGEKRPPVGKWLKKYGYLLENRL